MKSNKKKPVIEVRDLFSFKNNSQLPFITTDPVTITISTILPFPPPQPAPPPAG